MEQHMNKCEHIWQGEKKIKILNEMSFGKAHVVN